MSVLYILIMDQLHTTVRHFQSSVLSSFFHTAKLLDLTINSFISCQDPFFSADLHLDFQSNADLGSPHQLRPFLSVEDDRWRNLRLVSDPTIHRNETLREPKKNPARIQSPTSYRSPGPWNLWENHFGSNFGGSMIRKSVPSRETNVEMPSGTFSKRFSQSS